MTENYRKFVLEQFPTQKVLGVLFSEVENLDEIKTNLISSNEDYNFAFINCDNIVSLEQIYSTLYKSLLDHSYNRMKSKTLHTEMIFNLSPQKNIMDCLNKFGISKTSHNLIALKTVDASLSPEEEEAIIASLVSKVSGKVVAFDDKNLLSFANFKTLKQNYKLGSISTDEPATITRLTVAAIQLKGL